MRILLDNTIPVRAHSQSAGLARDLLVKIVEGSHTLLLSNEMLAELSKVLRYPRLQKYYALTENLVFE